MIAIDFLMLLFIATLFVGVIILRSWYSDKQPPISVIDLGFDEPPPEPIERRTSIRTNTCASCRCRRRARSRPSASSQNWMRLSERAIVKHGDALGGRNETCRAFLGDPFDEG